MILLTSFRIFSTYKKRRHIYDSFKPRPASTVDANSIRSLLGPIIAIIVGIFMVILDSTAINEAIPKLMSDFDTSLNLVQWTITGYTLAQAAVIPLAGWMSDRYGPRCIFIISIILFVKK
jgi:predicted MFS family arabinose efflux permease